MMRDPLHVALAIAALDRPLLVALDVDGTLAPIVEDPGAARVPRPVASTLRALSRAPDVRVALVTGRDARSLGAVAPVPRAFRAVEHGRRILRPGEPPRPLSLTDEQRRRLDAFRRWAMAEARGLGARVELKEGAVAVHVRDLVKRDPAAAERALDATEREAQKLGLHARAGRAVREVEAIRGDKGHALSRLVRLTRARGTVYAGDDLTDFPAIARASDLDGVGVFVRSRERRRGPSRATAVLDGPGALSQMLAELLALVR